MTRVKFCGIKTLEEARCAERLQAWAIGEVFAPSSRRLEPDNAARINRQLKGTVKKVGVFVNEKFTALCDIIAACQLDMVQLHGEESPEYLAELPVPAIKSISMRSPFDIEEVKRWRPWAYLFDAYHPGLRGGSGQVFDWAWLEPLQGQARFIVAGGLNPDNVGIPVEKLRPFAVDVSSGVEMAGGGKDFNKMARFMQKVKEADSNVSG